MSKKTLGLMALIGAMLCWGPTPVVTKLGLSEIPPFSFAFIRFFLAFLIILPIFWYKKHHRLARADIPRFVLIGILGSGLNAVFAVSGLARTSAISSAAIFATIPLVNAVAASLILRERPSLVRAVGITVGLIGSILIALAPVFTNGAGVAAGDVGGNLLIAAAVFTWVAYIIVSRELLEKYSPITVTTYSFFFAGVTLFPLAFSELITHPAWFLKLTNLSLITVSYMTVLASIVPFFLYQWGLKYTSAFSAGVVTYLNPVTASFWAALILGEKPTFIFLIGTGLIFGGIFLATIFETIQKRRGK